MEALALGLSHTVNLQGLDPSGSLPQLREQISLVSPHSHTYTFMCVQNLPALCPAVVYYTAQMLAMIWTGLEHMVQVRNTIQAIHKSARKPTRVSGLLSARVYANRKLESEGVLRSKYRITAKLNTYFFF